MKNFIVIVLFSLVHTVTHSSDKDVEKRITELEAELKNLKKKSVVTQVTDKPQNIDFKRKKLIEVVDDPLDDSDNDLDNLLPLNEISPVEKNIKQSLKKTAPEKDDLDVVSPNKVELKDKKDSPALEPKSDRAFELYDQGKIMLGQGKLDQAQQIFQEIITAYPESVYFIIAQYWIGELALNKHDYMAASLAYGTIFEKYKSDQVGQKFRNRVAESLIKFSYCLKMLKKNQEACIILDEFNKEFKDVPRNIHNFATMTRSTMTCPKK